MFRWIQRQQTQQQQHYQYQKQQGRRFLLQQQRQLRQTPLQQQQQQQQVHTHCQFVGSNSSNSSSRNIICSKHSTAIQSSLSLSPFHDYSSLSFSSSFVFAKKYFSSTTTTTTTNDTTTTTTTATTAKDNEIIKANEKLEETTVDTDASTTTNNTTKVVAVSDEWIPPNRPLLGDQGGNDYYHDSDEDGDEDNDLEDDDFVHDAVDHALFQISEDDTEEEILQKLEQALALEEALEEEQLQTMIQQEKTKTKQQQQPQNAVIDWMETRRIALRGGRQQDDDEEANAFLIPTLQHVLLTSQEIQTILESLGGTNIVTILDNPNQPRMGGGNVDGMIFCTAPSVFVLQTISRALVDHLQERKLQDLGVSGAQLPFSAFVANTKASRRNSSTAGTHSTVGAGEHWNVIDCQNYMVHIMGESTRTALKLEELWSGKDPLWKLNLQNDDAIDDYVAKYPVPKHYGPNPIGMNDENDGNSSNKSSSSWLWNLQTSKQLQRQAFVETTHHHRPVISREEKLKQRRIGKQKKREQKQQKYKQKQQGYSR